MISGISSPATFTPEQRERLREVYRIILSWQVASQAEQPVQKKGQSDETPQDAPVVSGSIQEEA